MKKILIFHTAFIGDIVLSTPFVEAVKEQYPDSKIVYVTTPAGKAILKNNPDIDEIIAYDKRGKDKGVRGAFNLSKKLKSYNFDIAYIPHRYLRSSLIVFLAKISKRVGFSNSEGKIFLNEKYEHKKEMHEVEKLLFLLWEKKATDKKEIKLFPGKEEIERIDKIFYDNNLKEKKIVTIAAGSKWETKKWPVDNFNYVIENITKSDKCRIILVGAKDELKLGVKETENTVNLINKTSLLELAEVLKRSDIVLTNDSSPIHIASAFEKPHIMAIFGATVKELGFYPWSKNSEVIEVNGLYCRPCGLHGGNICPESHFRCMKDIKPEKVYKKIIEKLEI